MIFSEVLNDIMFDLISFSCEYHILTCLWIACSFTVCIGLSCFSLEDHCREELVCCFLFDIRYKLWSKLFFSLIGLVASANNIISVLVFRACMIFRFLGWLGFDEARSVED